MGFLSEKRAPRQAAAPRSLGHGAFVAECLALVALVVLLALGLAAARRIAPAAFRAQLALPDSATRLELNGFYGPEGDAQFGYRWTKGAASVRLPLRYDSGAQYVALLYAQSAHPSGPQPIVFALNGRDFARFQPGFAPRRYRLLLPPGGDANLRFAFRTTPFTPPTDKRELGLVASYVALAAVPRTEWSVVVALPLVLLVLYGVARRSGPAPALALTAALAALLGALYLRYDAAPLPYLWLALPVVGATIIASVLVASTPVRIALAALLALVGFGGLLWPSWFSDDAFISFRYAQNLVAGHGLVYNVGERVEGYTNFLWTLLAALVLALGGDPVFWAYAAGVALALACVLLTFALGRQLLGERWALIAALVVATSQSLMVYTSRGAGLETGLFTLLVLAGAALYLVGRWPAASLALAAAALTRPEGVLVMALTLAHALVAGPPGAKAERTTDFALAVIALGPRPLARRLGAMLRAPSAAMRALLPLLLPFLLVSVPYMLWRTSYYGDLLPNTFYAKTGGGPAQWLRGFSYAGGFALALGGPMLLLALLPPTSPQAAPSSPALGHPRWWSYLALLCTFYTLYIIAVGGDHFPGERFFVPIVPWLGLLLAAGLQRSYRRITRWPGGNTFAPLVLVLVLVAYSWNALGRSARFDTTLVGNDESVWIWRELGWWMRDHTPPEASIAALGAGAIAYYSEHPVIDMLGLTDRHIARVEVESMGTGTAGHEKRDPRYVVEQRQPTYIPRMWDGYFAGIVDLRERYELITITTRSGRALELWRRK